MRKKSAPSVADMRRHIEALVAPLDEVQVMWGCRLARSLAVRDVTVDGSIGPVIEFNLPHIRSPISYATALHEIGHHYGRHQRSRNQMVRERWAWEWARHNALCWTPAMERDAIKSLAWYAARNSARQGAAVIPLRG